jgi:dipeptidyl aminopeptidase/acylaminoacyl peptidase
VKKVFGLLAVGLTVLAVPPASSAQGPAAPTGPLTAEELFAPRRLMGELSPSGRYLALVQKVADKDRLVVIDLETRSRSEVWNNPDLDLNSIRKVIWKGDERLLFTEQGIKLKNDKAGDPKVVKREGERMAVASNSVPLRLYSIPRTGGQPIRLPLEEDLFYQTVIDPLAKDDGHVLVLNWIFRERSTSMVGKFTAVLHKVDVVTGKAEVIESGDARSGSWDTDRDGNVVLRYDVFGRRGGWRVMGRPVGAKDWKELFSIREKDVPALAELEVLGSTEKPGTIYVAVTPKDRSGGDTRELRLYDYVTRTMGEKLWSHPKYDLDSIEQFEDGTLAAACYWAEAYRCDYFDKTLQAEYQAVDRFFDGDRSVRMVSQSRDGKVQLLSVSGPEEPGSLYLFNRKTGKIDLLGAQWPKLAPDRLGVMKPWRWTARDGVEIGGYLTAPPPAMNTSGALPLIVMPHGGPEQRDNLAFDQWGQAFATRGYLVFQPNFRGSGGFGASYAEAGYRQWGQRMQDDVLDGVETLIKSGKVNPNRICIVGASYGGYVALQGGARRPDLFKCVISRAGVADLVKMQKWEADTFETDSPRYKYWLKSIGDYRADQAMLNTASPVTYAADFKPPVLLLHGENDWTVPIEQSRLMEKALKGAGKQVRLVEYTGQGHSGWAPNMEVSSLKDMLAFIDQHIGSKK